MAVKLKPNPTFAVPVEIPTPSGKPDKMSVVFKHKTVPEYQEWLATLNDAKSEDVIFGIIAGWSEIDTEFTKENLSELLSNYHGADMAFYRAYQEALIEGRVKN
jgi:hypothetical protein